MPPAQPKRYYSVKEAASLIGVSTNTIYSYLELGKIKARRIGRGRFKIPYRELAPYIDLEGLEVKTANSVSDQTQLPHTNKPSSELLQKDAVQTTLPQKEASEVDNAILTPVLEGKTPNLIFSEDKSLVPEIPGNPNEDKSGSPQSIEAESTEHFTDNYKDNKEKDDEVRPMTNDKVFWRLFKAVVFLGLGVIYLTSKSHTFPLSREYISEFSNILNALLPWALILNGLFTLADIFYEQKVRYFDPLIHIVNISVLAFYAFISLASAENGRFIFAGSFAILSAIHLVGGLTHKGTFFENFTRFCAASALLGGIILILEPNYFPLNYLNDVIYDHRDMFAFLWFGFIVVPVLYLLSSYGKNSKLFAPFFYLIAGLVILVFATELAAKGRWDVSYLCYVLGLFALFMAFWKGSDLVLQKSRLVFVSISFIWVAASILIGLFVVSQSGHALRSQNLSVAIDQFDTAATNLRTKLNDAKSVLVSHAGNPATLELIEQENEDQNIEKAKEIYERTDIASRVMILNRDGIALGVYPRETLAQGANFSSRSYFVETKTYYKGITSDVFPSLTGEQVMVRTEPVFKENDLVGVILIGYDLKKLSLQISKDAGEDASVYALDKNGVYAFGSDQKLIGMERDMWQDEVNSQLSSKEFENHKTVLADPDLEINILLPQKEITSEISYINILLSVFVVVNGAFSILAGASLSAARKSEKDSGEADVDPQKRDVPEVANLRPQVLVQQ